MSTKILIKASEMIAGYAQKNNQSSMQKASTIIAYLEKKGHLKAGSITVLNGKSAKSKVDPFAHEESDQMKIAIAAYELRNIAMKNGGVSGKELADVPLESPGVKNNGSEIIHFKDGFPKLGFI